MMLDLSALNEDQRRAVIQGDGRPSAPLLVIAGAGSGKTNTLANRVANIVAEGCDPSRILLLTFSRRAAEEMRRRVERILAKHLKGLSIARLEWAGTFHAIGARLLREYSYRIGLDPEFSILDREDAADLMNLVRHELGLSAKESRFPTKSTCLAIYSRAVNAQLPLNEVLEIAFPWCLNWESELKRLFQAYVEAKQRNNCLDYDDLLLYVAQTMSVPELAEEVGSRFDHILVDEYQDTNRLQASILLALKPHGEGLTVVGDDAQSIYAFRAAEVRNILDFPKHFNPPAEIVTLSRNYRSTQPILKAANAVIALAKERFTKDLWSDRPSGQKPLIVTVRDEIDEAAYIASRILENREAGMRLKDQAVLFRTSHHSGPLELELTRRNIPYVKFGGLKFLDAAHIKDVLAVLRWTSNPRNRVAGFRVLQLLPGIGPANANRIIQQLGPDIVHLRRVTDVEPPAAAVSIWPEFSSLISQVTIDCIGWPAELARIRRWYEPLLEQHHEDASVRLADLMQLEQIAGGYKSREQFLTELTLDPPDATSGQADTPLLDEDYLILSTMHSAKGQEWRGVFVLKAADGCIPSDLGAGSDAELEEERRLLYVAMTRAKDGLELTIPQRFYVHQQAVGGDRHVYGSRTRFIPASILDWFDEKSWVPTRAGVLGRLPSGRQVDLAVRMKEMWK
jgi:DNA helicase II / ATP-dependent DNA helicase PcrA